MGIASINRVGARVVWLIGARSDDFAFEVEDDRFDKREIAQAIIETETDLVTDFAEAYHPQRRQFLTWLPVGGMDNGDVIPEHIGQIEAVRVLPFLESESEEEEDWVLAEKTTAANIKLWRDNHDNIFDAYDHDQEGSDLAAYFDLTNETLEFTGAKAQVNVVAYEPIYSDLESESEEEAWVLEREVAGVVLVQVGESLHGVAGGNFTSDDIGKRIVIVGNPLLSGTNPAVDSLIVSGTLGQVITEDVAAGETEQGLTYIYQLGSSPFGLGELQISDIWERCLVFGTISKLAKLGVSPEQIRLYDGKFTECRMTIRQGLNFKPEIDDEQKR